MKFTLDLHTHTVASGHAYSTVQEMAKAAADKGLKLLESQNMHKEFLEHAMRFISIICVLFQGRCTGLI